MYRQISNLSRTESQNLNVLVSSSTCLCQINWSHVLSREWRCSRNSAERAYSNYIWVIYNVIAYQGALYIRVLTVCVKVVFSHNPRLLSTTRWFIFSSIIPIMHCQTVQFQAQDLTHLPVKLVFVKMYNTLFHNSIWLSETMWRDLTWTTLILVIVYHMFPYQCRLLQIYTGTYSSEI